MLLCALAACLHTPVLNSYGFWLTSLACAAVFADCNPGLPSVVYTQVPDRYFSIYSRLLFTISVEVNTGQKVAVNASSGDFSGAAEACRLASGCVGFDSEGWLKSSLSIRPGVTSIAGITDPCAFVALKR
jgi:hypothetical protein